MGEGDETVRVNAIQAPKTTIEIGEVSDGYHTFNELYEHRQLLWLNYLRMVEESNNIVLYVPLGSSGILKNMDRIGRKLLKFHHYEGWFCSGIILQDGRQMSYHLEEKYWDVCPGEEREWEFNGHTSNDVLAILRELLGCK